MARAVRRGEAATNDHAGLRAELVSVAQRMNGLGINQGTSGNVSVRAGEGLLITPSGLPYDGMTADDIVAMTLDGEWSCPTPGRRPTSEWRFHRDILAARPDVGAVVHTHAMFSTTLSCLHMEIPPFHYMVAVAGGRNIRCAGYETFGTQALSDAALTALEGRKACLLANHGMLALGETLEKALALAVEVETLAAQYWRALQIARPALLDDAEMDRVLEKFKTYGQHGDSGADRPSGQAKGGKGRRPAAPKGKTESKSRRARAGGKETA